MAETVPEGKAMQYFADQVKEKPTGRSKSSSTPMSSSATPTP
jgi:TRAP-type C4-dicarboxylate transport system substrate-binding protein